jgi:hypothetical protein
VNETGLIGKRYRVVDNPKVPKNLDNSPSAWWSGFIKTYAGKSFIITGTAFGGSKNGYYTIRWDDDPLADDAGWVRGYFDGPDSTDFCVEIVDSDYFSQDWESAAKRNRDAIFRFLFRDDELEKRIYPEKG